VFQDKDGLWLWNCFAGCGEGDEIMFLRKLKGLSLTDSMILYLNMAGFPPESPSQSHEYPEPLLLGGKRKPDIGVFATCCGALLATQMHS
jgi:hypothetical protein